ncbi:unnamed protein product [Sphagnum troendelagicum]|uniref:Uncharacterized protein n=1 Tax=Sphagnum troendelagicum TaxID=128251 RepID=A0ABP0TL96_9BRYO
MAFEVARVHGIIRSNIREDGSSSKEEASLRGVVVGEVRASSLFDAQETQPNTPPSESSPHSTDTEGEEEDDDDDNGLLAGLAQHIAETMLYEEEEEEGVVDHQGPRGAHSLELRNAAPDSSSWSNSGSCWSSVLGSSTASSTSPSSSRVSSQVSSPPTTPLEARQNDIDADAWDLLYTAAAAGEVHNLKMKLEPRKPGLPSSPTSRHNQQHIQRQQPVVQPAHLQAPVTGLGLQGHMLARNGRPLKAASSPGAPCQSYMRNEADRIAMHGSGIQHRWNSAERLGDDRGSLRSSSGQMAVKAGPGFGCQSRTNHEYHHHQHQHQGWPGLKKGCNKGQYRSERFMDYNSPQWTAANGQGSGMRAVFLGSGGGSGRESSGTGVFIPRCAGNGPELNRKPACSTTVLLPSRIVQALNLNVENIAPHCLGTLAMGPSKSSFEECCWLASCGKACPSILQQNAAPELLNLPSEWTY